MITYSECVYVCERGVYKCHILYVEVKGQLWELFSPSILWTLVMKLGLAGLAARAFANYAMLSALKYIFWYVHFDLIYDLVDPKSP